MGFLDGLKKFGFGDIEEDEIFDDPKEKEAKEEQPVPKKKVVPLNEEGMLFDKSYTCPVCDNVFTSKTVKTGKARAKSQDIDLRNVYGEIDPIKYDVITCPDCGYSALAKYYGKLTKFQIDEIKSRICANYQRKDFGGTTYSYEEAFSRYELALATAMARKSKNSEKAYLCLKMAWLKRGEAEHLDPTASDYEAKKKESMELETDLLKKAFDGFTRARQNETPPIAGMDSNTLDYLMAALGIETCNYDVASKLIGNLIVSRTASPRLKEKAKDLKEILSQKKKDEE